MKWRVTYDAHRLMDTKEVEGPGPLEALRQAGIYVEQIDDQVRAIARGTSIAVRPIELRWFVTFKMDESSITIPLSMADRDWLIRKLGGVFK